MNEAQRPVLEDFYIKDINIVDSNGTITSGVISNAPNTVNHASTAAISSSVENEQKSIITELEVSMVFGNSLFN